MGITVYGPNDRLKLKVGELVFHVSPMTFAQKLKIQETMMRKGGQSLEDIGLASFYTIKYSIKDVEGLEAPGGEPWKPSFEEDGSLTDQDTEALLSLQVKDSIIQSCLGFVNFGFGKELRDPGTGDVIKGVEIIDEPGLPKKK